MPLALYSGTFDPVTQGHMDITQRAARLFAKVVIGIFDTPAKTLLFSTEERVELFRKAVEHIPNVEVMPYAGLTVDFAHKIGATTVIRGVRSITDVDYEAAMVMMNRKLQPQIDTIFLYTSLEYQFVSSTLIKEVARYGGDISNLVAEHVAAALKEKFRAV
ncbi:MAG: pantetheine-phosphate adenylyltransferase [Chloroflexi bacterium]|nr:pantetheine-phosphate adenylyltransferase [Chloroflexota bacterium]MBI4198117.1 pantetheine-phosphate adenylyltransferase [Chloroflexota bacterium]